MSGQAKRGPRGRGARRGGAVLALSLLAVGGGSCVPINGGAAEVAWELRQPNGSPNSCDEAAVDQIRLCWQSLASDAGQAGVGSCTPGQYRDFPCKDIHGATQFEVAPGRTLFWVEPVCGDGNPADPSTYDTPAPIARTVESGKIVELQALVIVATSNKTGCPATGCTCTP